MAENLGYKMKLDILIEQEAATSTAIIALQHELVDLAARRRLIRNKIETLLTSGVRDD